MAGPIAAAKARELGCGCARQQNGAHRLEAHGQRRNLSRRRPEQLRAVLGAVKAASRRLRRWPAASLDRTCARRAMLNPGRDGETLAGRTKKRNQTKFA